MSATLANLKSYPRSIFLILGNELCERYCYYSIATILTMFFIDQFRYDKSTSVSLYHMFASLNYITPLIGSILADSWLGRFRVIMLGSLLYIFGLAQITAGSITNVESGALLKVLFFVGIFFTALATGGIKPCVSAFAADQFSQDQKSAREQFFAIFYFTINCGMLAGSILSPFLRENVRCFGSDKCYPLSFGVANIFTVLAFIIFVIGKPQYRIVSPAKESQLLKSIKCICTAVRNKFSKSKKRRPLSKDLHWLNYSSPKFEPKFIKSVHNMLRVMVLLFIPGTVFWALNFQINSTWVIQGTMMDGHIGGNFSLKPDQMIALNPVLILTFVPLFEVIVFPIFRTFCTITSLRKMAVGGVFTALSFVLAGINQINIDSSPTNTVNIAWQLPQYFILTAGEVLFSVNGLEFAYSQSSAGLKSVMQAMWLFTAFSGNVLATLVSLIFPNSNPKFSFFGYAILMLISTGTSIILSTFYEYAKEDEAEDEEENCTKL